MVYEFYHSEELMHSGIKDQKWGVRRFQNPDGTWTAAGKLRYGRQKAARRIAAKASKSIGKAIRSGDLKGVGKSIATAAKDAYKYHTSNTVKKLREDLRDERFAKKEDAREKREAEREQQKQEQKERADREAKEKPAEDNKQRADVKRYNELRAKKPSDLTYDELKELTDRLNMEKAYKDLVKQVSDPKIFDAKKFAAGVLEDSGKKIISGLITYGASVAINKVLNAKVFNVQNPQSKDKKEESKEIKKGKG